MSNSITSTSSNALRITGMATGLDTDTLIKQMMAAENMKVDKLKQNQQYTVWRQEAFRDIIKDFRELRDGYLLIDSPADTNMIRSGAYSGAKITASGDNSDVLTATALPGAVNGVTKVTVKQLATGAKLVSEKLLLDPSETNQTVKLSTKLSQLGITDSSGKAGNINIDLGSGKTATVEVKSSMTMQELINSIYNTKIADSSETLYSKIKVTFSELTQKLTIETRDTGSGQSLGVTAEAGLANLKLSQIVQPSQDAEVVIIPPGSTEENTIIRKTNSFTIDNVTYNLTKESPKDENNLFIATTLTTQANAEDSVKKVKTFIDKYNALVKKINDKLTEKKDYNYKPLTADQRKEMEEDDIKTWEEKAQKGILKNDGDLQKILLDMRNAFMSGMDSAGIRLSEVGIDTYGGLEAVSKPGQLKIDEAKLKKALEERGDQVMKLFTASGPSDSEVEAKNLPDDKAKEDYRYQNTGIFRRIESIINNSAAKFDSTLLKKAGYEGTASEFTNTITKQIQDQDKAISELNRKLYDKQERYYQMFARLESAMNQMNSQQSWLAQQLG